ncbi:MAG: radical SAM protein [Deltaproteobacteria bacterium]|nr:radical SAM protein [Deltaproteobacteria bacterium]
MSLVNNVKQFTVNQASKMIIQLLAKSSSPQERLVQMCNIGEKMTDDPETLGAIDAVRKFLKSDHPAKALCDRVLNGIDQQQRVRLFETLFLNAWFTGGPKRDAFEAEHGFRPPFIMIFSPTLHCNLRCKGCYTLGYGRRPEIELSLADDLISQAEEMGINFVSFLGGEPLMYPHLFDLIEGHPNVFFQCYTNATLLDEEKCQRFAKAGNVLMVVSIEGDEEETDSWRGPGVHKKIMAGFEMLNEAKVLTGASATVTSQNAYKVGSMEFIDKMVSRGVLAQNYFLYIPVNGQADMNLMVTPEQRDNLRRVIIEARETRPMFFLDFWNDGPYVGGCIAGGRRYFHVNAKGDVEPCVYTHIATDNIRDVPLAQALNSPLFQTIRDSQPHNTNQLRPCMIIDNPEVMRRITSECNCHFTHPGAEEVFTDLAEDMDAYAARWGKFADKVWEEEYMSQPRWQAKFGSGGEGYPDWHNFQGPDERDGCRPVSQKELKAVRGQS